MSITQGPGFRANETIPAYVMVFANASTTFSDLRVQLPTSITSVPVGISRDLIQPEQSGDIATDGFARLLLATTTAVGDFLTWQTTTGQGMPLSKAATQTTGFFAVALAPGTNGSIIPVQICRSFVTVA